MGLLDFLITSDEVDAARVGKPISKGETRLQENIRKRPLVRVTEKDFKAAVWLRDKSHCRCCGQKVAKVLGRVPERGEVNHIHGRLGDLRFEVRSAILMCLMCHEQFTGKVNQNRLTIIPSKTFTIRQGTFTDATFPVKFR